MSLEPATGNSLAANGGSVKQNVRINNTKYGARAIMMKIKVMFTISGTNEVVTDQTKVTTFPDGL